MPIKKIFKCPYCKEEITKVCYICWTSGKEWGTAQINEDISDNITFDYHDCDDSETNDSGDYEYTCPECEHIIHEEDFKNKENNEENDNIEKNEDGEPLIEITNEINENLLASRSHSIDKTLIICNKCNRQNIMEEEEDTCVCTNCNSLIRKKTANYMHIGI